MTPIQFLALDTIRTIQPATAVEVAECCGLVFYEACRVIYSLCSESLIHPHSNTWSITTKGQQQWENYANRIALPQKKKSAKQLKPCKPNGSRKTTTGGQVATSQRA